MPAILVLSGGTQIRVREEPGDVREALSPAKADATGLVPVQTLTGEAFINPAQVAAVLPGE